MTRGLVIDLFAGGGGASAGIEAALGRPVDIAINHDAIALAAHAANHPRTIHLETDVWDVDPLTATGGRPVDVLWASPDCTHFSVAKGGKPRKQKIRSLAWVVCRWARDVQPRLIFLENVAEFRGWGPLGRDQRPIKERMGETFRRWKRQLERLGYAVDYQILDASKYGAPTRRRRLLATFRGTSEDRPGSASIEQPLPTISAGGVHVAEVRAFLTAYYGDDHGAGKGQCVMEPMRTLTAKARLGLVTVHGVDYQIVDIGMRMLEPDELLRAQFGRFAAGYDLSAARTKAGKVRLIGNSVCPEAAEALVRANAPEEMLEAVA